MADFSLDEVKSPYIHMFSMHALGVLREPPSEEFNTSFVSLSTIVETNFAL